MKKCPYCAEEIQQEAIKCRYCHSDLTRALPPQETLATPPGPSRPRQTVPASSAPGRPATRPQWSRTKTRGLVSLCIGLPVLVFIGLRVLNSWYSREVYNENWKILPLCWASFPVSMTKNQKLEGRVLVDNNDLNILVMDEQGFGTFKAGGNFKAYENTSAYRSRSCSLSFKAPATRKYYIILDNQYSILTPKSGSIIARVKGIGL